MLLGAINASNSFDCKAAQYFSRTWYTGALIPSQSSFVSSFLAWASFRFFPFRISLCFLFRHPSPKHWSRPQRVNKRTIGTFLYISRSCARFLIRPSIIITTISVVGLLVAALLAQTTTTTTICCIKIPRRQPSIILHFRRRTTKKRQERDRPADNRNPSQQTSPAAVSDNDCASAPATAIATIVILRISFPISRPTTASPSSLLTTIPREYLNNSYCRIRDRPKSRSPRSVTRAAHLASHDGKRRECSECH